MHEVARVGVDAGEGHGGVLRRNAAACGHELGAELGRVGAEGLGVYPRADYIAGRRGMMVPDFDFGIRGPCRVEILGHSVGGTGIHDDDMLEALALELRGRHEVQLVLVEVEELPRRGMDARGADGHVIGIEVAGEDYGADAIEVHVAVPDDDLHVPASLCSPRLLQSELFRALNSGIGARDSGVSEAPEELYPEGSAQAAAEVALPEESDELFAGKVVVVVGHAVFGFSFSMDYELGRDIHARWEFLPTSSGV